MMPQQDRRERGPAAAIGLIIMALGVALLLDRAGVINAFGMSNFWPFALICVGLVKLTNLREDGRREGGWWVFTGVLLLLNEMHVWRFRQSWPLFLMAIGISIIWNAVFPRLPRAHGKVD
jgi:hypothetical protein